MKKALLAIGTSLLLSTQITYLFAGEQYNDSENQMIEDINSYDSPLSCARSHICCSDHHKNDIRKNKDVLACLLDNSVSSLSATVINSLGEISKRDLVLTVLRADTRSGVYMMRVVGTSPTDPAVHFIHEFVIGRVERLYFGRGISGPGINSDALSILIRQNHKRLEITYSLQPAIVSQDTGSELRAVFPLPKHCQFD